MYWDEIAGPPHFRISLPKTLIRKIYKILMSLIYLFILANQTARAHCLVLHPLRKPLTGIQNILPRGILQTIFSPVDEELCH